MIYVKINQPKYTFLILEKKLLKPLISSSKPANEIV